LAKIEKLARTSNESIIKHTGKSWDTWIEVLKKAGAENLSHKEIVQLLNTKYKLKPWFQQIVTGGFEVHIGRRREGENEKGEYTVTVTKTLPVDQKTLWKFITSIEGLAVWLKPMDEFKIVKGATFEVIGGIFGEVRTVKSPIQFRLRWEDSDWVKKTVVQVYVHPRPKNKSMFGLTHEGLANPRIKEKQRSYWKNAVEQLALAVNELAPYPAAKAR
tara:strand:+ start:62756 stop:63406 length:651 start_codon:yes stop_codon:yes gene_type:complete